MKLKKICPRCKASTIDATQVMCERCAAVASTRHIEYDRFRRDKKYDAFYKSKEWRHLRAHILMQHAGIDVYLYHHRNRLAAANTVHHIVELSEDWSRRLDPSNLIPLSSSTHAYVHKVYESGGDAHRKMQERLFDLVASSEG